MREEIENLIAEKTTSEEREKIALLDFSVISESLIRTYLGLSGSKLPCKIMVTYSQCEWLVIHHSHQNNRISFFQKLSEKLQIKIYQEFRLKFRHLINVSKEGFKYKDLSFSFEHGYFTLHQVTISRACVSFRNSLLNDVTLENEDPDTLSTRIIKAVIENYDLHLQKNEEEEKNKQNEEQNVRFINEIKNEFKMDEHFFDIFNQQDNHCLHFTITLKDFDEQKKEQLIVHLKKIKELIA